MDKNEFERRLASIPEAAPDELDEAMLAEAASEDDGTSVTLTELNP